MIAGPPFGIYHEPITSESAGMIEVSLPICGPLTPSGMIVLKEIAGGQMATTVLQGDPAKMAAYDAIYDWISKRDCAPSDLPREVWVGPDDGPFEILWPFEARKTTQG